MGLQTSQKHSRPLVRIIRLVLFLFARTPVFCHGFAFHQKHVLHSPTRAGVQSYYWPSYQGYKHNQPTSRRPVSPCGIDQWPEPAQALVFVGIYATLARMTIQSVQFLDFISKNIIGLERWRNVVLQGILPVSLGVFYLLAGTGHFLNTHAFVDIYPPQGTWGIWYLPGSAEFHVAWTGVVEALGGGSLLTSGVVSSFSNLRTSLDKKTIVVDDDEEESLAWKLLPSASSFALLLLTVLVTPANIYMFTHGAEFGDSGSLGIAFHLIRFVVQILLLTFLFTLARDTLAFAWGDELD